MPLAFADEICESLAAPVGAALVAFVGAALELEAADELAGAAALVGDADGALPFAGAALAEALVVVGVDELSFMADDFLLFLVVVWVDAEASVEGAADEAGSEATLADFLLFFDFVVEVVSVVAAD